MKVKWLFMAAGLTGGIAFSKADPVKAFGLELTVISNAAMSLNAEYPIVSVFQVGGPECGNGGSGTNEVDNMPFGVSVHLGEAESGVFIYPDADCRENGLSMWGNAYGSLNGHTNELISTVKGTRVDWGVYCVDVDLTPLGATSYIYQVWSHGVITLRATNRSVAAGVISTYNIEDYDPRANPLFLTDAGPAALIEFPNGTYFSLYLEEDERFISGVGDRIFIIAEGATNHVDYLSRVDVFGSAGLPSFAINDARLGMFGRPHKALGTANFSAANGRLAVRFTETFGTGSTANGLLVDFKNGATSWTAQTEPFALEGPDAHLVFSASGFGAYDRPSYSYWEPAALTRSNGLVHLSGDFSDLGTSNVVLRVYRSNELAGSIYGPRATALASLTETNPLITGWTAARASLFVSLANTTRVTGHEGTILEGDRFEFAPHLNPVQIAHVLSTHLRVYGISQITILSEHTEDAIVPELKLNIERSASGLVVSWPFHRSFYLIGRSNLNSDHSFGDEPMTFRDFHWYMPVNPTNATRFYSLSHGYWYYINP